MRRILWLLLGMVIGFVAAGYWADGPLDRLAQVETRLESVRTQLRGVEGALAQLPSRVAEARVELRRVAELVDPVDAAFRTGDDRTFVATRPGRIFRVDTALAGDPPQLVLDISSLVDTQGAREGFGGEAGLLALAFSPGGNLLYVTYTGPGSPEPTSVEWTLAEYEMDGNRADPSTARVLLTVDKRYPHHNGGDIAFGPDGYLYTSVGDGAPYGDLLETGQDPTDLLGSLFRLDPTPTGDQPYSIPPGNPFADGEGAPEVWAYGLRNPWRFSFDRVTGDLWIADVGDREEEEINRLRAAGGGGRGANLGWSMLEGTFLRGDAPPPDAVAPLHRYQRRRPFCAIIGGFVYRGNAIPALRGAYLFSDYCDGELRALQIDDGVVTSHLLGVKVETPSSFAEDHAGELYVVSLKGEVFRIERA